MIAAATGLGHPLSSTIGPVEDCDEIERLIQHAAYALSFGDPEREVIEDLQDDHGVSPSQAYLATRAAAVLLRETRKAA